MILVAGRGSSPEHGLYVASDADGEWMTRQLDTVEELAALAAHPTLPVVYGLSGLDRGRLLAWDVSAVADGGPAVRLADLDCLGDIPCDLAVDPSERVLVSANYGYEHGGGGSLSIWRLDERGVPADAGTPIPLTGSSVDPARQSVPHPHQIVFGDGLLHVPDLGLDAIRRYEVDAARVTEPGIPLVEREPVPVPPGTGPRHMILLGSGPDARIVTSGELSGELVVVRADPADPRPAAVLATRVTGPAKTRTDRNYPGDVKLSADGAHAYFANRGHDTLATIALAESGPELVAEVATPPWPQHLLVHPDRVLLAAWDGSEVLSGRPRDGVLAEVEFAFAAPGAGWLLDLPGAAASN